MSSFRECTFFGEKYRKPRPQNVSEANIQETEKKHYIKQIKVTKKDDTLAKELPYKQRAESEKKEDNQKDLNVRNGLPYTPRDEVETKKDGSRTPYWSSSRSSCDTITSPEYSMGPDDSPSEDIILKGRNFYAYESTKKSTSSDTTSTDTPKGRYLFAYESTVVGVVRSAHLNGVIMIIVRGEASNDGSPGAAPLDMTTKFDMLVNFEGQDFRHWQKKMHFLLTTLKVVYVLSTPSPEWHEDETLETTRKRMKWENKDYICRGHILNGMDDSLLDIYQKIESAKALWESLESKYMAEDASSKKFLVGNFMNYKMVDTRPVMDQYHEMLRILRHLKHKKEELNLVQLGSHLRIEEGLQNHKLDNNPKGKNQIGSSSINMVEGYGAKNSKNNKNNKNKRKFNGGGDKSANKKSTLTKKVPNLTYLRVWGCRAVVRLTEPKMKILGEKGIDCIFIGYDEHSKCYRFYVIKPNDYVSVNSIIESRDAIFDEERFTSIPGPRGMIQPSSIEGMRDKTVSLREYCYIIEEDPRTLSEAMASRDVAFCKEAIQSEIDSIMHNDTWELTDLPPRCKALGCKWILKRKMKVDGSIDKYKAR
nr:hypothetical protein [Tanacetum cinerariifolium]